MRLALAWDALRRRHGLRPPAAAAQLRAAPIDGFQPAAHWRATEPFTLQPKGSGFNEGWLLALR